MCCRWAGMCHTSTRGRRIYGRRGTARSAADGSAAPPTLPPLWLNLWVWGFSYQTAPSRPSAAFASPRSWASSWSPLTRIWDVPLWTRMTLSVAATRRGTARRLSPPSPAALPMIARLWYLQRRRMMHLLLARFVVFENFAGDQFVCRKCCWKTLGRIVGCRIRCLCVCMVFPPSGFGVHGLIH